MSKKACRRRDRGGFTLVELIVVLAILAILATLLIPTMTGYIDKANEEKIVAETRMAVMAAQTVVSENYARDPENWGNVELTPGSPPDFQKDENFLGEIQTLSETPGDIQSVIVTEGKVTALSYTNGDVTCDYQSGIEDDEGNEGEDSEDSEEGYTVTRN
ncbi:MAG TPA: type II secretion system GspH family protein [Candidatus Gemmiger stercoravium]|nr:type II secretion system GspH family protein [Candidatus Gemmiger stercoravium]